MSLEGQWCGNVRMGVKCAQGVSEAAPRGSEGAVSQVRAGQSASSLIQKFQDRNRSSCRLIPKIFPN